MEVGFFFWPFNPDLVRRLAAAADRYGYDMIGIADTPGNAMDPWVAATMVAEATKTARVALCVTNLELRHPSVSAAAIASLAMLTDAGCVLGIGAGHSGTKNLGLPSTKLGELEEGISYIRTLLTGQPASLGGGRAQMPWIKKGADVFVAASGPQTLQASGRVADGVFVNYGLKQENIAQSEGTVLASARQAGRPDSDIELWQIAALDCDENSETARNKIGAILAFMAAGYILGDADLAKRGVPEELHAPLKELRQLYSTRPGDADAALVTRLGLFPYLAERFAIYGTPEQCAEQMQRAKAAGLKRVMFTVSLATDPVRTVELFGEKVLPRIR